MKKIGPTAIAGGIAAYLGYKFLDDKLLLSNVRSLFLNIISSDNDAKKKKTGSRVFGKRNQTSENVKNCRQRS